MVYVIDCVNLSLTPKRPEINPYKTETETDGHSWKNELSRADFILHTKTVQIRSDGSSKSSLYLV